ncbi:hypothetical protein ACF1BQ_002580 [Bradyrhizobium sp. RDT10]
MKLAPFGVTTLNFGICCSRFYSSVLVGGGERRHFLVRDFRLLRDLIAACYNRRLLPKSEAPFPLASVTKR